MTQVSSELKHLNISPRKIRLIVAVVKGQSVEQALLRLRFTPKRAAKPMAAVIKTARADAVSVHKLDADKLTVKEVTVMEGST
jgi:large subunit ribosomal protein L22